MSADTFFICFRQFYYLTQSDDFAKAIAFAYFLTKSQNALISPLVVFIAVFCMNNYIVSADTFFI